MRTKDILILLSPVALVILAIILVRPVLVPSQPPIAPPNPPPPSAVASPAAAASPGAAASPVVAAAATTPAAGQSAGGGGKGNPQNGAQLFVSKGCAACHKIADIPGAVGQVGPELTHVGTVAASRKPGMDAEAYIRESVRQPPAFLAPGFPNDMPTLPVSDPELDDLVAMLLAHK